MPKIDHLTCAPETIAEARRYYEAYLANSDGLAWNGLPCPTWDALNDAVRSHWCAVATEAAALRRYHELVADGLSDAEALAVEGGGEIVVHDEDCRGSAAGVGCSCAPAVHLITSTGSA